MLSVFLKGVLFFLAGLLALAGASHAGTTQQIHLYITGVPETSFTGECIVSTAESQKTLTLSGVVPATYALESDEIFCTITQTSIDGTLQVEVHKNGNVSRSRIGGENNTINLRVR